MRFQLEFKVKTTIPPQHFQMVSLLEPLSQRQPDRFSFPPTSYQQQ